VHFASGYVGRELNRVGEQLAAMEDVIAVSGDDSVVCRANSLLRTSTMGFAPYGEGDFSSFDQSQRASCIRAHGKWMTRLSIPAHLVDLVLAICGMKYKAKGKRLLVEGDAGPELATGIDWTTVINSMSDLCFWFEVFARPSEAPVAIASSLGFELKFNQGWSVYSLTFLKGWWQQDACSSICWYPLPSQVLKLGKTLRPLRLFSAGKKNYTEGVATLAYAIAASMPGVPRDYPILGPFLSTLCRLGKETNRVVSASEDGWYKPQVSAVSVNRRMAIEAICERYDLTEEDIVRVEGLIGRVRALPAFLSDPVFLALSARDYA